MIGLGCGLQGALGVNFLGRPRPRFGTVVVITAEFCGVEELLANVTCGLGRLSTACL
jgi:ethanolamine utilization microcompartment shell protein EutS